jgi:pimeloyl-ACP methyl ester carboxylesterase
MPAFSFLGARYLSRKALARLAVCLSVGYTSLILVLLSFEDSFVFHPYPAPQPWIDSPPDLVAQDVYLLAAGGGRIHARWYPCREARGAVLVCHSRAGNLSRAAHPAAVRRWHDEVRFSVLVFDYPGYGYSQGTPSEAGCYAAARAAYDWLTEAQRVPPERLFLMGRSLGTAVAVELASRRPHRALILVSPLTSIPDVARSLCPLLPAHTFMRNRFDSLSRIGGCPGPLLVFHGTHDRTIPFAQGTRLFAAARCPKRFVRVEGAGHNDTVLATFFPELRRFLADTTADPGWENAGPALASVAGGGNMLLGACAGPREVRLSRRAPAGAADMPQEQKEGKDERAPDASGSPRAQRYRR